MTTKTKTQTKKEEQRREDVEVHGDEHTMQTVWADLFENTAMMRRDWEEFAQAEPDRFTKQANKIQ